MLPDAVANQIAAGEVIQRPASVIKELMENAIDAGASTIQVIVKDAGRSLIQVIDDGKGMSEVDALMCWERHATSKISSADQLFSLNTKGFRGEALASIAAVAQVEMKTRQADEELGRMVCIEGSKIKEEEPCQCSKGTSFSIKNLFFNVPARRNFLKSDAVEMKHIIEEFQRLAIPHAGLAFQLYHNGNELFNLKAQSSRQRIVGTFGAKYDERLVPVEEETDIVSVMGFVGKPEFARRTRGEQYLFVNDRFIKSTYLNHAISKAFEDLLPEGSFPFYTLFLSIEPHLIDVNIHPTKTELKFQDERAIYAILRSCVRRSLGRFNIAPSLDFDQESSLNLDAYDENKTVVPPSISVNPNYNPFDSKSTQQRSSDPVEHSSSSSSDFGATVSPSPRKERDGNWKELYAITRELESQGRNSPEDLDFAAAGAALEESQKEAFKVDQHTDQALFQLHRRYVVTQIRSGMIVIDQQRAHQRILFEHYLEVLANHKGSTQQSLFPETVSLGPSDHALISALIPSLNALGFDIEEFGQNDLIVRGVPVEAGGLSAEELLERFLDSVKHDADRSGVPGKEDTAKSLAMGSSIRPGTKMESEEMRSLVDELFACEVPYFSPRGLPTIITFTLEDLDQKFKR